MAMNNIFSYTDYRKALTDYYLEQKKRFSGFSYQAFAIKAGFPNRGFLHNVISGKKNVSGSGAIKLAQAMKLSTVESDYFENLVSFNQAKNLRERNYFFGKLEAISKSNSGTGTVRTTLQNHYDFYTTWYISAIRSLIDMHPFKGDYKWLAANLYPPIKPKEAKRAVAILQSIGMIRKKDDDTFEIVDKTITAGDDVVRLGLLNFQLQTTKLALNAITELPKEKRHVSGLTLGISRKTYETICTEIADFQSRLQVLAEKDDTADNVYQLNFHFIPVSNVNGTITGQKGRHAMQRKQQ
jgi:uncharacterized protein (TIGR02147 family)